MLAVATLAIGADELAQVTVPRLRRYTRWLRAQFVLIDTPRINGPTVHWEKLQVGRLLEDFDRVLFLDLDILLRKTAPNFFMAYPETHRFVAHDESWIWRIKKLDVEGNILHHLEMQGFEPERVDGYFNSGVMLASREHRHLFDVPKVFAPSPYFEQCYLNANRIHLKIPWEKMPHSFNAVGCGLRRNLRDCGRVLHFAGVKGEQRMKIMEATLRKDPARFW